MNWIRKEKRVRIHERDKWTCVWCGAGLGPDAPQGERTLDHVIARMNGGSNEAHNLVTACRTCNTERGDLCAIDYAFGPLFARTGRKPWLVLNDLIECVCRDLPARAPKPHVCFAVGGNDCRYCRDCGQNMPLVCPANIPGPGGRLHCAREARHPGLHRAPGGFIFGDE